MSQSKRSVYIRTVSEPVSQVTGMDFIQHADVSSDQQGSELSEAERAAVLDVWHSPPFVDIAPAAAYARLRDEGLPVQRIDDVPVSAAMKNCP